MDSRRAVSLGSAMTAQRDMYAHPDLRGDDGA
jgi:hypothetical protein